MIKGKPCLSLTNTDKAIHLGQGDGVQMHLAVQEHAPQLQACEQEGVVWGVTQAKAAVEAIDGAKLRNMPQHCKLYLKHTHTHNMECHRRHEWPKILRKPCKLPSNSFLI